MKRMMIITVLLLLLALVFILAVRAEGSSVMTAQEVIKTSYNRYRQGVKVEKEKVEIGVVYEARTVHKKLVRWIKYGKKRRDKMFIKFTAPPMDKGLKLLVHRRSEGSDLMWLKLPSLRRSRRISGQDEGNYFAETDLTYRDTAQLVGEIIDNYEYEFVGTEYCSVPGEKAIKWVIKAEPREDITAIYGHRFFFITKDLVIAGVKYFDFNGDLIKVQLNKKVVQDECGRWRADLVVIKNLYNDRTTKIKVTDRNYNNSAQAPSFSKRDLRR
jgi:hypothetical protein